MTRQNTDYGYEIQKVYLEMMMTDAESFVRAQAVFEPTSFDRRLQDTATFLNDYVIEHNALPTFDMINAATDGQLKHPGDLQENHYDWLLKEFETFSKHKALEKAILDSADLLEKGEYGACEELVKKAVQIGLQKDLGTDYWADPRGRLEAIKDKNGQISTGWPALDKKLFGGFNRGELNIFAGGSGSGKSLFLANMGVNWALAGLNVVYLTFELSENLVSMRVDSMTTDIPSRDVFKSIDDVEMKVKMIGKKSGALQVKYMPTGKNANDIRSYLKEYEIKTGNAGMRYFGTFTQQDGENVSRAFFEKGWNDDVFTFLPANSENTYGQLIDNSGNTGVSTYRVDISTTNEYDLYDDVSCTFTFNN